MSAACLLAVMVAAAGPSAGWMASSVSTTASPGSATDHAQACRPGAEADGRGTVRTVALEGRPAGVGTNAVAPYAPPAAAATGAGATFPEAVYLRWASLFRAETGNTIAYEGTGSGAGVKAVEAGGVAFGATDVPLPADRLTAHGLVQFPTLVGGVVPVVNLPGIGPGDLVLDGPTLADLFLRLDLFWDDPEIARHNPHLPLPHLAVVPVRRSDASGMTAVLAAYLARTTHDWDVWFRENPSGLRPIGPAVEGSAGMARAVAATPGAIGYLGFDEAQGHRLAYADLINPAGRIVQPTSASVAAAAASADWSHDLAPSLVARDGGASWPIVTATYVLMRRTDADVLAASTALLLFGWASRHGGPAAEDLGFVLPPARAEAEVRRRLGEIHDLVGRSLAPPDLDGASP